jgi:ABC-type sugar transport system permease subunit
LNAVQPRRGLVERIGRRRWNSIQAYLFISPWLLGFFIFTAGPMVASLFLSFTNSRGIGAIEFTGLRNYQRLVNDEYFWISSYRLLSAVADASGGECHHLGVDIQS